MFKVQLRLRGKIGSHIKPAFTPTFYLRAKLDFDFNQISQGCDTTNKFVA